MIFVICGVSDLVAKEGWKDVAAAVETACLTEGNVEDISVDEEPSTEATGLVAATVGGPMAVI
jgi:hypothetical protein